MMRHLSKRTLTLALGAMLLGLGPVAGPARADGLVPRFVTDPLTGVVIDGFDPVSYFTETEPLPGKPDFEFDWAGVPWYFANAANRDVFIRSPTTYAPQFGGHDAMALARGYLSDGSPQVEMIVADRLYLFYSAANRDAFELSPARAIADAEAHWRDLSKTMAPLPPTPADPIAAPPATGTNQPAPPPPQPGP